MPSLPREVDRLLHHDVLVVGSGLAGLSAALGTSNRAVGLLTKGSLGLDGSSNMAQGGVAAAMGAGDSAALHAVDTLEVAGGLGDPAVVRLLTEEAPRQIRRLAALGAVFDRRPGGGLALGREAAHSRPRIVHANGDATGAEIVRTLVEAVRSAPGVDLFEGVTALDLLTERGRVVGLAARHADGSRVVHLARAVVLCTGGIGHLFERTTNPREATGDGLAMAARAGARLVDLEFVQFHPTALAASGADPMPLLTEALRGAGAVLLDSSGRRFMPDLEPDAELAPRDRVARAIWDRLEAGPVFLDARVAVGSAFPERFPTVFAACRRHGLDPRVEPLPVSPAAHYHMGGIAVDGEGRSSLPGLWAGGETACTGAHGVNRLASNSLLEALVYGGRIAQDVEGALESLPAVKALVEAPRGLPRDTEGLEEAAEELKRSVRRLLWRRVGLVRDGAGLRRALHELEEVLPRVAPEAHGLRNLVQVGRLLAAAALHRAESRGSHYRSDLPESDPSWACRLSAVAGGEGGAIRFRREAPAESREAVGRGRAE